MRILSFDYNPSKKGGQEIALYEVLSHIQKSNRINLAYVVRGELLDDYTRSNINTYKIRSFSIINKLNPFEWFNFIFSIIKIKLSTRFDIIYINQIMDLPIAAIIKLISKNKKLICHLRLPPLEYNLKNRNNQLGFFLRYIDAFIVANKNMYNAHTNSGIPKEKISIIYDGLSLPIKSINKTKETKSDILKISYLGRIDETKGILEAVKGLKNCKDKGLKFHFTIGGVTSNATQEKYKLNIIEYITYNKMLNDVSFYGYVNDPYNFFSKFDLSIFSSITNESFGRTIVESIVAGTPVLANNVGWVKSILDDQNKNWIYNNQEEFEEMIFKFNSNPQTYDLDSKKNYIYSNFDIKNIAIQIDKLFNNIQNK